MALSTVLVPPVTSVTCAMDTPVWSGMANQTYGAVVLPVELMRNTKLSVGLVACIEPVILVMETAGCVVVS